VSQAPESMGLQRLRESWSDNRTMALGLLALAAAVFVLYALVGPGQYHNDGWFPLADAFLHGRLWIDGGRPWIERVPGPSGEYFLPFPPVPALVLVPQVALFGQDVADTGTMSALVGALNVFLVYALLSYFELKGRAMAFLIIAFFLGSEYFYVAATGGIHHWTEILVVSFLLGALNLALRGRWPWVGGILFGLAVGCRPSVLLAGPALAVLYWRFGGPRAVVSVVIGAALIGLCLAWYNWARFGSPSEFGYDLITGPNGERVLDEPWYSQGIESPFYIARGLYTMFLRSFEFDEAFPWLKPSWAGTSVLLTMPFLVYLGRAVWKSPLILAGWLGLLPLLMDLMHGNPGFAQFGYRFILDGMPFIWMLLAMVVARNGLTRGFVAAVAVGVFVNSYGLACIWAGFITS
jgi:hypothetical protein